MEVFIQMRVEGIMGKIFNEGFIVFLFKLRVSEGLRFWRFITLLFMFIR